MEEKKKRKLYSSQITSVNKYVRKVYDRCSLFLPKGKRAEVMEEAKSRGITFNELVKQAITAYTGINLDTEAKKRGLDS